MVAAACGIPCRGTRTSKTTLRTCLKPTCVPPVTSSPLRARTARSASAATQAERGTTLAERTKQHYQKVAAELIDQIERGTAPWT